jgi:glucosamine-6-phosphate deaminase
LYKKGELDFSGVKTVNLDEYKGLSSDMEQSYHYYMQKNLFCEINILQENIFLPNGMANDELEECKRYDEILKKLGGIDLQLLSIGHNGHIGFNEPSDTFSKRTHVVNLDEKTRNANARFFENLQMFQKVLIH